MSKYRKEELTSSNVNIGMIERKSDFVMMESPRRVRPTTANSLPQSVPDVNSKKREEVV
jgi:hypothetical protein